MAVAARWCSPGRSAAARLPPLDLTGGHLFESPANPRKKRFGDEEEARR